MNHPAVERTLRTGYPVMNHRREEYGIDALGNEVFTEDEILVLNEEFFLAETLTNQAKEVLELLGATYEEAQ